MGSINLLKRYKIPIDDNGRLVLSLKLRNFIDVDSEAIFIGMGDKFQVWEPSAYNQDMEQINREFDMYDEENNPFNLLHPTKSLAK